MASRRYIPLRMILIPTCLDVLFIVLATAVAWDSKPASYNLDKGPVIYEAYYPDTRESSQEKRYLNRNAVLETSFQLPFDRFAYSSKTANRPLRNDQSSIAANDEKRFLPKEEWKATKSNSTNEFVPFYDKRSSTAVNENQNTRAINVKEISTLVRRAISRDLESWNALKGYFEHMSSNPDIQQPIYQPDIRLKENSETKEHYNYPFRINQPSFSPLQRPRPNNALREFETPTNVEQSQSTYLDEADASENTTKDKAMCVGDMQAADTPSVNVISDSSAENPFESRPELITYTFFKRFIPRLDERTDQVTDQPHHYGDNLIREEIANANRDEQVNGNVKITSIEVSKLPQHKVRHHHDEWPKRHYPSHRHRSQQSAIHPIDKEKYIGAKAD